MCWKKPKGGKSHYGTTIFMEVLLNDEEATMQQLNKMCGNRNIFSYIQVPRRRMPIEVAPSGAILSHETAREGT
jgi:hypothetical protein